MLANNCTTGPVQVWYKIPWFIGIRPIYDSDSDHNSENSENQSIDYTTTIYN